MERVRQGDSSAQPATHPAAPPPRYERYARIIREGATASVLFVLLEGSLLVSSERMALKKAVLRARARRTADDRRSRTLTVLVLSAAAWRRGAFLEPAALAAIGTQTVLRRLQLKTFSVFSKGTLRDSARIGGHEGLSISSTGTLRAVATLFTVCEFAPSQTIFAEERSGRLHVRIVEGAVRLSLSVACRPYRERRDGPLLTRRTITADRDASDVDGAAPQPPATALRGRSECI